MISVRTRNQVAAVAALQFVLGLIVGALFLLALSPLGAARLLRQVAARARRAIKPAALWWNAALYKVSEDNALYARSLQANSYEQELVDGGDSDYFRRFRLALSAEEHRERVRQQELHAQRDRINQW